MPAYSSIKRIRNETERTRVIDRLLTLRRQLDRDIPAKTATDTLLLATWNIRDFADNRSSESLHYLAEIVSRFDLVAVQEVASNHEGLVKLVALLGQNWDYIVTDCTEGVEGGGERMAFIYDRCKVFFRKIAGELVLPKSKLLGGYDGTEQLQFARTPFSVAFQAGWFRFMLTTVHIYYGSKGDEDPRRVEEITAIAQFIKDRAAREDENYILLGDFNIAKTKHATMDALLKKGFYIPEEIREHPSDLAKSKHYDQIAFKLKIDEDMTVFTQGNQRAGTFDFTESVYKAEDFDIYREYFTEDILKKRDTESKLMSYYLTSWRTYQMSDHLPLWIELKIDFSNQFLEKIAVEKPSGRGRRSS